MKIRLGHSPDSDDAFMFWGLANGQVKSDYEFEHILRDIQTLNEWAFEGRLESTAISVHAFAYVADKYALLRHGGSFGEKYGPMIVASRQIPIEQLKNVTIAVPGLQTSAFLELNLWFYDTYGKGEEKPWALGLGKSADGTRISARDSALSTQDLGEEGEGKPGALGLGESPDGTRIPAQHSALSTQDSPRTQDSPSTQHFTPRYHPLLKFEVVPFDEIIPAIQEGRFEAGLIIHEGQLTYERDGLKLIADFGKWWDEKTGLPLPLGVNTVRKDMGEAAVKDVSRCMRESITAGLIHRGQALDYALQFARGMDPATSDEFVGMYVNQRTLDMGEPGVAAIRLLLAEGAMYGLVPPVRVDVVD